MDSNAEHDADLALVNNYRRAVKIACDEVYDDPFDKGARARLTRVIEQSRSADAAQARLALRGDARTA